MLDSSAFQSTGSTSEGGGTTTPSTGGGGGTTTTPTGGGGAGGTTSSTMPNGGGGTGGTTTTETTGGGGTGGTTTTTVTLPTSCKVAKEGGATGVKVTEIDPDGEGGVEPFSVLCDQDKDGGGWALLYNSVGDPMGQTTAFWNIPYDQRFVTKGEAALDKNYYAGALYRFGKEYRDDAVDQNGVEALGIMRATANGINEETMKLTQPVEQPGSLSAQIYSYHFASGWSSSDHDDDPEAINCAVFWANVTQHYAGCWKYSLGADTKDGDDGAPVDYTDGGWGPHIVNKIIDDMNTEGNLDPPLTPGSGGDGDTARMNRISRFTRW